MSKRKNPSTLPIVKIGAPVLRTPCKTLDVSILKSLSFQKFFKAMVKTMYKEIGVGLAANQVGYGLAAIVLECKSNKRYPKAPSFKLQSYINPRILEYSPETEVDWEGCLSIPGYRGLVPRSKTIVFEGLDDRGRMVKKTVSGFEARVFQHEVDHINGLFYIDRMPDLKLWGHNEELGRLFRRRSRK